MRNKKSEVKEGQETRRQVTLKGGMTRQEGARVRSMLNGSWKSACGRAGSMSPFASEISSHTEAPNSQPSGR